MRKSMSWIVLVGEVVLFGIAVSAVARSEEYRAMQPTRVPVSQTYTSSPYTNSQPVRVSMKNAQGQVTTLEYRQPVRVVAYEQPLDDGIVPLSSLPVLSSPARESDLVEMRSDRREVRYVAQPAAADTAPSLPVMQIGGPYQPTTGPVVNYGPPSSYTYSAPMYNAPNYGVPQTMYRPVPAQPIVAVADPSLQVSKGIYGQPTIYRPGQPVRNFFRYLTP